MEDPDAPDLGRPRADRLDGAATVNEVVQGPTNQTEQAYEVSWRITNVDAGRTRSIDVRVQWTERNRPDAPVRDLEPPVQP